MHCACLDLLPVFWTALSWKLQLGRRAKDEERAMKRSKFSEAQIAFFLKQ